MYEELVKRLRAAAKMSEALAVLLPHSEGNAVAKLHRDAADAIEALSAAVEGYESSTNMALVEKDGKTVIEFQPKWIPVEERCPEKSGDYLVFDDCRNLYVNEWHCLLKKWQYDDSRITHWMPLPQAPKEE